MAKSKMILKSNFRKLPGAAEAGLEEAVDKWLDVTENAAKDTVSKREAQRGYALNTLYAEIEGSKRGNLSAAVTSPTWYARFFEYGTRYIEPMPYLRPAKRKGDAAFKLTAGSSVERAFARRARVR
jgi:HK97 gp10 family phage protein